MRCNEYKQVRPKGFASLGVNKELINVGQNLLPAGLV